MPPSCKIAKEGLRNLHTQRELETMTGPKGFRGAMEVAGFIVELFDLLPDVVFFGKDDAGRYEAVNHTLVRRLGRRCKEEVLGRTTVELFPSPLGDRYLEQDHGVCASGRPLEDLLELHLYPDGVEGWCITDKRAVRESNGAVIGLVGISRDVQAAPDRESLADLAEAVRRLHEELATPLRIDQLAATARMSTYRFNRRIKALFGLTPAQLLIRTRIDAARHMLVEARRPVAEIALACGYCDQSAFTRQFKRVVGLTPAEYRARSA